jgi:hypothetical protein
MDYNNLKCCKSLPRSPISNILTLCRMTDDRWGTQYRQIRFTLD